MGAALERIRTENLGFRRFSMTTWVNPVWVKKEKNRGDKWQCESWRNNVPPSLLSNHDSKLCVLVPDENVSV